MPNPTLLTVTSTEHLSPGMVRVRFRSDDLSAFEGSSFTDRYVKLVLGSPDEPVVRTYTAIEPDVEAGTVAIDFVVHGDEGYAGPWAATAKPGDTLAVRGPGGAFAPDPSADWHLLAGDEAGLPAIRATLQALPVDAVGHVVVQVPDAAHEQPLPAPSGVTVQWIHGESPTLGEAVRAIAWRDGRVQAFVHGEAADVMHGVRPYLIKERGLPRADLSISGYWRRGRTEEGFRAWKQELSAAEGT